MSNPLSSIGAVVFSNLAVFGTEEPTSRKLIFLSVEQSFSSADNLNWTGLFKTASSQQWYTLIPDVREFPSVGTPPNIVNVPVYGQKQSQTVSAQADAPTMDVVINYVASKWLKGNAAANGTGLGNMIGDGIVRPWRLALLNAKPTGSNGVNQGTYDSNAGGLGTVENAEFYWLGRAESLLINASLTDAVTATISLSVQSDFYGAYAV